MRQWPLAIAVADLHSKILDAPPPGVQILSISCSFWENLAKSYVGASPESWRPLLGEILDPPLNRYVNVMQSVLSVTSSGSRGVEGTMPPPWPCEISHKKDGRLRRPHRFHVSRPPPNPAAGSATGYFWSASTWLHSRLRDGRCHNGEV